MTNLRKYLDYISYLMYPLMGFALYLIYKPLLFEVDNMWEYYNRGFAILGIALSFASFKDLEKSAGLTGDWLFSNPRRTKIIVYIQFSLLLLFIGLGVFGYFFSSLEGYQEMSPGILVFGIAWVSQIKMAVDASKIYERRN